MSCLTTSATRRSRIDSAAVLHASAAASSHDELLVPMTSITLYTLMFCAPSGLRRRARSRLTSVLPILLPRGKASRHNAHLTVACRCTRRLIGRVGPGAAVAVLIIGCGFTKRASRAPDRLEVVNCYSGLSPARTVWLVSRDNGCRRGQPAGSGGAGVAARTALVMTSTACWLVRPWSMHRECQVQNEAAWPMTARVRRRWRALPPNGDASM